MTSISRSSLTPIPIRIQLNVATSRRLLPSSVISQARDSTTTLKFDGQLEPVAGSTTEVGKERFPQLLERRLEEHGHETFYYVKYEDKVVNLFAHVHKVTLDALTEEFKLRMTPATNPADPEAPPPFSAFDK
jgi:hypothetical protein